MRKLVCMIPLYGTYRTPAISSLWAEHGAHPTVTDGRSERSLSEERIFFAGQRNAQHIKPFPQTNTAGGEKGSSMQRLFEPPSPDRPPSLLNAACESSRYDTHTCMFVSNHMYDTTKSWIRLSSCVRVVVILSWQFPA